MRTRTCSSKTQKARGEGASALARLLTALVFVAGTYAWVLMPSVLAGKESLDHQPAATPKSMSLSYEKLARLSLGSQDYWNEFVTLQKKHYEASSWDRFFGFAAFYRGYVIRETPTKTFIPDLVILELLGLIKHCQFEPAAKVLKLSRQIAQRVYPKNSDDLKKLEVRLGMIGDYIKLQGHMPTAVTTEEVIRKIQPFSKTLEWKIPTQTRSATVQLAIKNPMAIRLFVEDLCKKE